MIAVPDDVVKTHWPNRPYCSENKAASHFAPLAKAIGEAYIQCNPHDVQSWLLFDIDRPGAWYAWEEGALPRPTWIAETPSNRHAHVCYGLRVPVTKYPSSRFDPIRYCAAIEAAFRERLGADQAYCGLMTKNPYHARWNVSPWPKTDLYELGELAEYVTLDPKPPRVQYGLGRNVRLFDSVRKQAYKEVQHWRDTSDYETWRAHLLGIAMAQNAAFVVPLDAREVGYLVKSVARWTWQRYGRERPQWSVDAYRRRQVANARLGGLARSAAYEDKRASARLMRAKGMTLQAIGDELGVPKETVRRWCD